MANPNIGRILSEVWEECLRESPDLWDEAGGRLFDQLSHIRHSYRYWLDRQPRNVYGEKIPRIVTVRRHLRQLGNIRLDPKRLR